MSDRSSRRVEQTTLKVSRDEASRILMALTIRRNELRRMGKHKTADEFTQLCQRIAREFEPGVEQ